MPVRSSVGAKRTSLERDAGHHDERGHRQRLRERIRQVADRQDAEVERDQMVDGDGARGSQTISPNAHDHAVQQRRADGVGNGADDAEQGDIGRAPGYETGKRRRENVEPWRALETGSSPAPRR